MLLPWQRGAGRMLLPWQQGRGDGAVAIATEELAGLATERQNWSPRQHGEMRRGRLSPWQQGPGRQGCVAEAAGGGIWAASSALGQDRDTAVAPLAGTAGVGALRSCPKNLPGWARRRARPHRGAAGSECEQGAVWVWQKIPGSASCDGHSHLQAREDEKAGFLCAPDSTLLAF